MGSLGGGVWIAPHADREPLVTAALRAEGAIGEAVSFLAEPGSLGRHDDLAGAWNFHELGAEYQAFLDRFAATAAGSLFRAQTELVHAWRRLAFLDPDLPGELLPRDWPRPSAHRLFQSRNAAWREAAQAHFSELDGSAFLSQHPRRSE